jgi:hypothetical protein
VRRRHWKRRGIYLAIAAVSAGFVVFIGVRIAMAVMSFWVSGGEGAEPALLASGGAVPDSIVRLARETRSVQANERIAFVFIQAHHTFADALLVTDSAIIRRTPHGTTRRSLQESDINLQPMKRGGSAGGLLIVKRKGSAPDTLYQDLSGREAFLLMNAFVTLARAQKARDSTSK